MLIGNLKSNNVSKIINTNSTKNTTMKKKVSTKNLMSRRYAKLKILKDKSQHENRLLRMLNNSTGRK